MNPIIVVLFITVLRLNGLHFSATSKPQKVVHNCASVCCAGKDGRDGLYGRDGINGQPGQPGRDGIKGKKGERGEKGESGPEGKRGFNGIKGDRGESGYRGMQGQKGEPGPQGVCNKTMLENEVKKLQAKITALEKKTGDVSKQVLCALSGPAKALGMNSCAIKNKQVTASSVYKNNVPRYGAHRARLNYKNWNGWNVNTLDVNQWLQISFERKTLVTDVATQGYRAGGEWVKTYQLSFSKDGSTWNIYQENGLPKTFTGNSDKNTVVKNKLQIPVLTYFIRFLPKTWNNHIGMRVEVYGCYL